MHDLKPESKNAPQSFVTGRYIMQHHAFRASELTRHAFETLVALWLTIFFLTFAIALLLSASEAKADIYLPLPKAERVFEPAVLKNFSPSPTPALVDARCQTYLHPLQTGSVTITNSSRTQRNADTRGLQAISAIKAYRHCVSQITLEQMANK
jgi:hypothetical protein